MDKDYGNNLFWDESSENQQQKHLKIRWAGRRSLSFWDVLFSELLILVFGIGQIDLISIFQISPYRISSELTLQKSQGFPTPIPSVYGLFTYIN